MNKNLRFCIIALLLCSTISTAKCQEILLSAGALTNNQGIIKGYPNHVPITSFQMGVSAPSSWSKGGNATIGQPVPMEIQITKLVDALSNKLSALIVQGKSIQTLEIIWLTRKEATMQVSHKVELSAVFLTEILSSSAGDCGGDCPAIAESYKLIYKAIKRTVYAQDRDGNFSRVSEFTWDVPTSVSSERSF